MSGFVDRLEAEKPKILTIDDDRYLESNIEEIENAGFVAISAHSVPRVGVHRAGFDYEVDKPDQISSILQEKKPTVIITDYDMGKFTAPALIQAIRATPGFENIPIMIRAAQEPKTVAPFLINAGIDLESISFSHKNDSAAIVRHSIKSLVAKAKDAGAPPLP